MPHHQSIIISSVGKPKWADSPTIVRDVYSINNQLHTDGGKGDLHTTMKHFETVQSLVEHTAGDVYDPFCGSGTTLVACQNLSRRCRAIEISEKYCAVILERMATAFPGISIERVTDGQTTKQGKARGKAKAATRAR